jgi:hypothetical protein
MSVPALCRGSSAVRTVDNHRKSGWRPAAVGWIGAAQSAFDRANASAYVVQVDAGVEAIKLWAKSATTPTPDLAIDKRVLDVVVEELTLGFGIEQFIVDFQGNVQIAIGLAARERDIQFAGVIVVFDERHDR